MSPYGLIKVSEFQNHLQSGQRDFFSEECGEGTHEDTASMVV